MHGNTPGTPHLEVHRRGLVWVAVIIPHEPLRIVRPHGQRGHIEGPQAAPDIPEEFLLVRRIPSKIKSVTTTTNTNTIIIITPTLTLTLTLNPTLTLTTRSLTLVHSFRLRSTLTLGTTSDDKPPP